MTRVLITGAGGFIGKSLRAQLSLVGDYDIALTDAIPAEGSIQCDLSDPDATLRLIENTQPDHVFHLAGRFRGSDADIYRANLFGTLNLIDALEKIRPESTLVAMGSAAEYGNVQADEMPILESRAAAPFTPYGISKLASTTAVLAAAKRGLSASVVRPFNVVGAGMPDSLLGGAIISRIRAAMASQGRLQIEVGRMDTARDFVPVTDLVNACIRIAERRISGEIIHLCSGVPTQVKEFLDTLTGFIERPVEFVVNPDFVRPDDVLSVYGSCEKAIKLGVFEPKTPLSTALKQAWEHTA